jgi:hypothetical protein
MQGGKLLLEPDPHNWDLVLQARSRCCCCCGSIARVQATGDRRNGRCFRVRAVAAASAPIEAASAAAAALSASVVAQAPAAAVTSLTAPSAVMAAATSTTL